MPRDANDSSVDKPARRRSALGALVQLAVGALGLYLLTAYLLLPAGWRSYERRHPALDDAPRIARTASGIPGDPLNVALVGTEADVQRAMISSGWFPADPITWKSSMRIAGDSLFHRSYTEAPVSSLYVWKRKQDLAFERPAGADPRRRHHVRFWRAPEVDDPGRPLWLGAATYDTKFGFSHTTGQITHHIAPDVDAERDRLIDDLNRGGSLADTYWIDDFAKRREARNGGGDSYHTDGRLEVGVLAEKRRLERLAPESPDRTHLD